MRVGTRIACEKINKMFGDHPHACGDKVALTARTAFVSGSSPCVWGQVYRESATFGVQRIIPMRVGTRSISLILS